MKIEIHSLLHNEILMLPYFVKHYSQFGNIIFYESNSTDGSPEFAEALGCKVIKIAENNNEVDERIFTDLKNNCWKGSKADWVIICDTDEFVYHPRLIELLENSPYTMYQPREFLMYSREFPTTSGQIYDEIKHGTLGVSGFGKTNLFKPSEIQEINYNHGSHSCSPVGNINLCPKTAIKTLHYHYPSVEYRINRNKYIAGRLSNINRVMGWGNHHTWSENKVRYDFEQAMKRLIKVV